MSLQLSAVRVGFSTRITRARMTDWDRQCPLGLPAVGGLWAQALDSSPTGESHESHARDRECLVAIGYYAGEQSETPTAFSKSGTASVIATDWLE